MKIDEQLAVLCFQLGDRWFGFDAQLAEEVVGEQTLTPVPGTPPYISGVFGLHGRAIVVLDLSRFLGLPKGSAETTEKFLDERSSRTVVVRTGDMSVGIPADRVYQIVESDRGIIREPRMSPEGRLLEFTLGELDLGDRVVTVLNLPTLILAAKV